MRRVITLCRECRSIQRAESVCSICGARVEAPHLPVARCETPEEVEAHVVAQPVTVGRRA